MELKDLKNIGPKRLEGLNKLNIYNLNDLVFYAPNYYEDRKTLIPVKELKEGVAALVYVKIISGPFYKKTSRNMDMIIFNATDGERAVDIVFFNQRWAAANFKRNLSYFVFGKPSMFNNKISFINPIFSQTKTDELGSVVPVYPLTKAITNKVLRQCIKTALGEFEDVLVLPRSIAEKYNIINIKTLLNFVHFPDTISEAEYAFKSLAYIEAFLFHVMKYSGRSFSKKIDGFVLKDTEEEREFLRNLPFLLTDGQKKAIVDIKNDSESKKAMNRLIQGDVGSGKTVVSQYLAVKTVASGYQVAFMAPTTLLAIQNYEKLKTVSERMGFNCCLITSKTSKFEKNEIRKNLITGDLDILVGTHSLLNEDINFKNLGSVIIDEQHRFGVKQRDALIEKQKGANILVMSATPIPRSLALILYGDMDISEIHSMPKDRRKIDTFVVAKNEMGRVNGFVESEIKKGRQAYYVCPLIEDSEKSDLQSAKSLYQELQGKFDCNIAILTGQTSEEDKDEVMEKFKNGEIDILVSTTVIEVGIDVPNASTIVIMNAERFGLAQLHQLRGRVGRGKHKSTCIIVHNAKSEDTYKRLKTIERNSDGFYIAIEDLKERGPGEILGLKQSGAQKFKFLDFERDLRIVEESKIDFDLYIKDAPKDEIAVIKRNATDIFGIMDNGVLNWELFQE